MYQIIGYSLLESSFPCFIGSREDVIAFLHQQIWRTVIQLHKAQSFLGDRLEDFQYEINEEKLAAEGRCNTHKIISCEAIQIHPQQIAKGKDVILETIYTDGSTSLQAVVVTEGEEIVKDREVEKKNAGKEITQTHLYDPEEWLAKQKTK